MASLSRLSAALVALGLVVAACASGEGEPRAEPDAGGPAGPTSQSPTADEGGGDGAGGPEGGESDGGVDAVSSDGQESDRVDPFETVGLQSAGPVLAVVVDERRCDGVACYRVFELAADGAWIFTDADGEVVEGGFDVAAVDATVAATDLAAVSLGPFLGECPIESGGWERNYRVFATPVEVVDVPVAPTALDVSSCIHNVDVTVPVIEALDLLMVEASKKNG